jgi:hypothetical protein
MNPRVVARCDEADPITAAHAVADGHGAIDMGHRDLQVRRRSDRHRRDAGHRSREDDRTSDRSGDRITGRSCQIETPVACERGDGSECRNHGTRHGGRCTARSGDRQDREYGGGEQHRSTVREDDDGKNPSEDAGGISGGHEIDSDPAEVVGPEGLREEGVGATPVGPLPGLLLGVSREDEDLQAPGARVGADALEYLPAIHLRQADVEDHQIRWIAERRLEARRPIRTRVHLETRRPQTHRDEPLNDRRILDDEYSLPHAVDLTSVSPCSTQRHTDYTDRPKQGRP